MNGDLLAAVLGAAGLGIYLGYIFWKKALRRREREQLLREFVPGKKP